MIAATQDAPLANGAGTAPAGFLHTAVPVATDPEPDADSWWQRLCRRRNDGPPQHRPEDFDAPGAAAPTAVSLALGDPDALSAQQANDILDCFASDLDDLLSGVERTFDAPTIEAADRLQDYVLSAHLPQDAALRHLVQQAVQAAASGVGAAEPVDAAARRDLLLRYMATPGWAEWLKRWSADLARLNGREMALSFTCKMLQSSLASGFQKAFLLAPHAGGAAGVLSLALPIVRQACAMYAHRHDARARAQLARLAQIGGCSLLLVLAASLGGWAMIGRIGAGALSYVLGSGGANLLRNIWPMQAANLGSDARAAALAAAGAVQVAGSYATQLAQGVAAPDAGTRAFSIDADTGVIGGSFNAWQQVVEAVLEIAIKEFVKTNASVLIQRRADARTSSAPRSYGSQRPSPYADVQLEGLRWPTLAQVWNAFGGIRGNNPARQSTAVCKSAISSFLRAHARAQGWSPSLINYLIPGVTAIYEALMNTAGLVSLQSRAAGDLEAGQGAGLNYDVLGGRRHAMVPSPGVPSMAMSVIQVSETTSKQLAAARRRPQRERGRH